MWVHKAAFSCVLGTFTGSQSIYHTSVCAFIRFDYEIKYFNRHSSEVAVLEMLRYKWLVVKVPRRRNTLQSEHLPSACVPGSPAGIRAL